MIGSEKNTTWLKHLFLSSVQLVIVLFTVFLIRHTVIIKKMAKVELSHGLLNFGNCTEANTILRNQSFSEIGVFSQILSNIVRLILSLGDNT